jgi:S-(hydroxymethyl)glutathione dehydrogenase/alcohol dehydrogenase
MLTCAALLWEQPGDWLVENAVIAAPGRHQVLVEMAAAGLCHSDDHLSTGDVPVADFPVCGGHEGSGVVREVGADVDGLAPGDHIVTSFIPSCGKCRWCATGQQHLCDRGETLMSGSQLDGTFPMKVRGGIDVRTPAMLGTFAEWQVFDVDSCIKVPSDLPLAAACLVSCGVPTGWGSAVRGADVQPGDVVIVIGVGGIGMNALQGARHRGAAHIVAVDPVEFKRQQATQFGATETYADIAEATDFVRSVTNGQGADSAIVTVGVTRGEDVANAFGAIRKAGIVVLTSQGNVARSGIPVNLFEMSMYQKRIQGVLYGNGSPRREVPRLLELYRTGQLLLDELITSRYRLEDINKGYGHMREGVNIRGVIDFEMGQLPVISARRRRTRPMKPDEGDNRDANSGTSVLHGWTVGSGRRRSPGPRRRQSGD